ncbi:exo-alpha-sialidase [Leifsonia sp. NPDC058194]|uniref:exo-alpha-sialidase n=1 Tax=Leifsonia sp. NPDC058194 TaxID=3346374 RepID=UPI0036DA05AE
MKHPRSLSLLVAATLVAATVVTLQAPAAAAPPSPVLDDSTSVTYTGSTYTDHTGDLSAVSGLSSGSIVVRFKTTSAGSAMTLISAANTLLPSSNLTLSVNAGKLHFEVRQNNATTNDFATTLTYPSADDPTAAATFNDGAWHTAAVTVGSGGTRVYADGYQVFAGTSTAFFNTVTGLNGMWIGRNVDSGGGQWYFTGTVASVKVYASALSAADVVSLSAAPGALLSYPVSQSFNGTSTYIDKTADLGAVSSLATGSIAASFASTSTAAAGTILSASDTTNPSSNITVSLNNGALYFEARTNGTYSTQLTAPGRFNDGATHTVVLAAGPAGTTIYADGYRLAASTSTAFFSSVSGLNGMWIGRNADNGGGQWYFGGTINWVRAYSTALSDSQAKNLAGATPSTFQALYDNGYAGSANYRIPALLTTSAGTLLASADQRESSAGDAPNDINTAIRRSTDGGATWSAATTILDYPGTGANGASAIDSAMVQDASTGRIYLMVDHFPGGWGQPNNQAGTGFDASGNRVLVNYSTGATYGLHSDGSVYTSTGTPTGYSVDMATGAVTSSGAAAGNIYLKNGVDANQSLSEYGTSYLVVMHSDDDGATWSQPVHINASVKASWTKFLGTGPGNGIQLANGRLEFPVYYSNGSGVYSSAVVYSDDHGSTWQRGSSPNDGRVLNGVTIQSQTVTTSSASLHEPSIVQKANGDVLMYMRNSSGTGKVATATSADGGVTWSQVAYNSQLTDVFSQTAAFHYPSLGDGKDRVLFANATGPGRNNGVLRLSADGGSTFAYNRAIRSAGYAYNSLTVLPDGSIGVLWELQNTGLYFQKLPLSFLTSSAG